jgi:hypothetical protein
LVGYINATCLPLENIYLALFCCDYPDSVFCKKFCIGKLSLFISLLQGADKNGTSPDDQTYMACADTDEMKTALV